MPEAPPPLVNALRDRYVVERELGRGGMATVYLARDLKHERHVALKVLLPSLAATLGADRFQREIRFAARLQHPHILTVLDSGEVPGGVGAPPILWFTMPYVRGESLHDRLHREGQLPVDEAVRITREAAQALAHAHKEGVVHRDVKPANILLTEDGSTLVADFGIARALRGAAGRSVSAPEANGAAAEPTLTETGVSLGTPAYMSPEQASGVAVDARSDLYSLACVCYEMLAGKRPYTGPNPQVIIAKRFIDPIPSIRQVRPSVAESIDQAIQRALAIDPADRFPTVAEFAQALASTARTVPTLVSKPATEPGAPRPAPPPARAKRPRIPLGVAMLGIGVLLGLGILFALRRTRQGEAEGLRRLAVLPFENLGDSADAYFADGVTDAVRGKLAALAGLQVTASTSSNQYRGMSKSPEEIGRELGVEFLLVGNVRWARGATGASRVQVSPELIQIATGSTKWAQPFDGAISDVFQVQGEIAARVADALNVALGVDQRQRLAVRPTENLAAYDAFLRAKQFLRRNLVMADVRSATRLLEEAVRLDPGFAEAWAELAITRATLSWTWALNDELRGAEVAAERALTLAPDLPQAHAAAGYVHYYGHRAYEAALAELRKAAASAPNDPATLVGMGFVLRRQGRWPEAIDRFERAFALDPQSYEVAFAGLGDSYMTTRQYDKAEAALERAIAIDPTVPAPYRELALVHIHRDGDTARAAEVVERAAGRVDLPRILFTAGGQLSRVLSARYAESLIRTTSASAVLKTPAPDDQHELDPLTFFVSKAVLLWSLRRTAAARANFDSARAAIEAMPRGVLDQLYSEQGRLHSLLSLTYAGLGRRGDAVRHGELGLRLIAKPGDAFREPPRRDDLAAVYAMLGDRGRALDQLERLLAVPSRISAASVRLDPLWGSFRGDPRFERLVAGQ